MKSTFNLFLMSLLIFSCTLKSKDMEAELSVPEISVQVDSLLTINLDKMIIRDDIIRKEWIKTVYQSNNFHPIWLGNNLKINSLGDSVLNIFSHANYYGLEPKNYKTNVLLDLKKELSEVKSKEDLYEKAINLEVLLTDNFMLFVKHLNYGKIENIAPFSILERKPDSLDVPVTFAVAIKNEEVLTYLTAVQPKQSEYVKLQKALKKYVQESSLSQETVAVNNYKEDSVKAYNQAEMALIIHRYLPKNNLDTEFLNALKNFQKDHGLTPDGIIGKNTADALSKSPYEYYQNAAMSLERWRWKIPWEPSYIHINIPQFILRYYEKDSLQLASRVVVGTNYNRTPEVYSKLSYLVAYPYWYVPRSISVNEILGKAKRDSDYLRKNNYEVFSSEMKQISSDQINWNAVTGKNFNYHIRQKGGTSNALGLVKFIFQNNFSIYFHDTPTKYYFERDIRNYSHGCIRVQKAMELADILLKNDNNEYNLDSVKTYVERRKEKKMMMNNKTPIYIQYISCAADDKNRLIFYKDIYGYDEKMRKIFFE